MMDYTESRDDEVVELPDVGELVAQAASAGRFEPGTYHDDIPSHVYHRGPGISKSGLDLIARSPAHYKFHVEHPSPDTRATRIGTAFHTLLLEPERFDTEYVLAPYTEWRTKEAKEWRAAQQEAGLFVLMAKAGADPVRNPSEWDLIHRMRDSVMEHPYAPLFLQAGISERSMYWRQRCSVRLGDGGEEVERNELARLRADRIDTAHNVLVDIKTARDASYTGFARACVEHRYHLQREWYMMGARECGHAFDEFIFLVVESGPPYGIGLYTIPQRWCQQAAAMLRSNLETYARCLELDEWPAYPHEVRDLELPAYAQRVAIS